MSKPTASQFVAYAKKFVRSAKYGSPNMFTKWFYGNNTTAPWCAIFIYYCLAHVGGKDLMAGCANKAYCPTIWNWGKAKKYNKASGKYGDLVLFDWGKDGVCDHIGIFLKDLGGGKIQTLEGNTSSTSNGNGGCVQIRTRSKSVVKGYIRLPFASASKTKKKYSGTFPTLPKRGYFKSGDKGTQVKNLQKFLNWYGNYKLAVDGVIGAKTISAVKKFQKGVKITADGLFGKTSLAKAKAVKK